MNTRGLMSRVRRLEARHSDATYGRRLYIAGIRCILNQTVEPGAPRVPAPSPEHLQKLLTRYAGPGSEFLHGLGDVLADAIALLDSTATPDRSA